jgi:hypothetical protein
MRSVPCESNGLHLANGADVVPVAVVEHEDMTGDDRFLDRSRDRGSLWHGGGAG